MSAGLIAASLAIGGRYNWQYQPERLTYLGVKHYPGDRRDWHQFAKVESPHDVWCEALDADLSMFEETLAKTGAPRGSR